MKTISVPKIRTLIAGAFLVASCISSTTAWADYPSTIADQNPEGYWRFSETTPVIALSTTAINTGSLGASRNGTYQGDLAGRGVEGLVSNNLAAHFDGVSEYISVPWIKAINTFSNWSVETWYAPDNWQPSGGLTCVLSSGNFAAPRSGWLIYQSPTGFNIRFYNQNGTAFTLNMAAVVTNTPGTFLHLALTFDGTTAKFYTNGVLCISGAPSGSPNFVPGVDGPFSIAGRSDGAFENSGTQDEVAYYGTLLSQSQIAAHYYAMSTNNAGYATQITGDSPLLYFRLNEDPLLQTVNEGSYGVDFDYGSGALVYPLTVGNAGPTTPAFPGFNSGNTAVSVFGSDLSAGDGGYVSIPDFDFGTNTITITGWIKPSGSQAGGAGAIMFRSATSSPDTGTSAGLIFDASGGLGLSYNWDGDEATYGWSSGQTLTDGDWNFVSLIVKSNEAIIWAPGSNADPSTNVHTHASLDFICGTFLGTDPATSGMNGGLDEVAIFGRSLSLGEVYTEYATAKGGLAPRIFSGPLAPTNTLYVGDPLTLTVDAGGTAPITYQWRKNGTAINGATDPSYSIGALVAGGPDTYDVVVSNSVSTVASAVASITVASPVAPIITKDILITSRSIYPGGDIILNVNAVGGGITYQWQRYGTNLPGKNASSLIVSHISSTNAGPYQAVISNSVNFVVSSVANISVPATPPGSYEAAIVADAPVSWWRLDDAPGSTNMLDSLGRNDGTWNNVLTLGSPGALTNDLNTAATFNAPDGGWGEVGALPPPAASGDFSYEIWARPTDSLATESVPFSTFRAAYGFYFDKSTDGTWRGRDGYGDLDGTVSRQALIGNVTLSKWVHLVAVYSSSSGHRVYINGQWDGNSYVDFCRNLNTPMRVGALDPLQQYGLQKFFTGSIDEVAVYNVALTPDQVLKHYLAGLYSTNNPPVFAKQPQSQTNSIGTTATFTTLIEGSPTLGQLWYRSGSPIVTGYTVTTNIPPVTNLVYATSQTLTLTNIGYSDAIGQTYYCVATNGSGSVTSAVVNLTVTPSPAFINLTNNLVLHMAFEGNFNDSSGRGHNATAVGSPTIVPGIIGTGALKYSTAVDGPGGHGGNIVDKNYLNLGIFPPGTSDLSFSNTVNFSVAYWFRTPTNVSSGDLPIFCSAINSYQNYGLTFAPTYNSSTAGGYSWSLGDGSTFAGLYGPAGTFLDGQWHHLVHTFNWTTGDGITYVDGVKNSTVGITVLDDIDSGNPFCIGQDPTGNYNEAATNYLDDLAVWKGRVLTPNEAYAAYYVGKTYGNSFDVITPITISTTKVSGSNYIVWQTGTLYWADTVDGTYTVVPGATAPYYQITPTGAMKFFRVK